MSDEEPTLTRRWERHGTLPCLHCRTETVIDARDDPDEMLLCSDCQRKGVDAETVAQERSAARKRNPTFLGGLKPMGPPTLDNLHDDVRRRGEKIARQPQPDEDDPTFAFIVTTPTPGAGFEFTDTPETIALCVMLTRETEDLMPELIESCVQTAEERDAELRVYLGYGGLFFQPGYEGLQEHVEADEIDMVLTWKHPLDPSRIEGLSTSFRLFWSEFLELCSAKGVRVESFLPSETIVPRSGGPEVVR